MSGFVNFKMSQPSPSFHPEDKSNSELPLENSPSLENDEQIAMAGPSDEQIVTAGLSDEQIVTAGSSDEQIVMAGSSRKRKDEKPIESKEAKKVKLISVGNLKEKGKIYILLYTYTILVAIESYIM